MPSEMLSAEKYLSIVNDRGKRRLPLERVYHNLRKRGLFLRAYHHLYCKAGALTEGIDPSDTVEAMSLKRIETLLKQLEEGRYTWKPTRRVYVPKPNGGRRPISVPGWSDKLVQEAIRMILEAYYEPRFRDSSHGFRPNRGCHTALQQIKRSWTGTKWFIEVDIKGCFDNLDHQLILDILQRDIHDDRFIKLVKGMLEAGYMEDWRYYETHSGAPQGGVASPILANVVLHELDTFIEDQLIPQYTQGQSRRRSREYQRLNGRYRQAKKEQNWQAARQCEKERRRIPSADTQDPNYRRLRYCRYADDILLGFIGPKAEAVMVKDAIGEYLHTLHLELNEDKTYLTHAASAKARFLGYHISIRTDNSRITRDSIGRKTRALNGMVCLEAPRDVIGKWTRKFTQRGRPIHRPYLLNFSDFEIVATYGTQLRGIIQYYLMAQNLHEFRRVRWACLESLRKTLATRHKLGVKVSFRRYWHHPDNGISHIRVVLDRDDKEPLVARCGETPLKVCQVTYLYDPLPAFQIGNRRSEIVQRLLAETCELCGREGSLEAHHVNKLSDLRKRWQGRKQPPEWVEWMLARKRKSIMVCRDCHREITTGKYDGRYTR